MKTAAVQLVNFLGSARQALQFDLWTIALASSTVLRWTDADVDQTTLDGRKFTRGPVLARDNVSWVRGIQVDQLKVRMSGPALLVDGQALPTFSAAGGFDGAWIMLERCYLNDAGVMQGSLVWFAGQVADVTPGRLWTEVVVKSQLTQLSQQLPRNLHQAGCLNDLYDSGCGVSRAAFTYTGTVTGVAPGSNPSIAVTLSGPVPGGFFQLGPLKFTSGNNAGLGRTVQVQSGPGQAIAFAVARPFPFAIAIGDTITVTAGCDKQQGTCSGKFGNLARFRGEPYVPAPETVT